MAPPTAALPNWTAVEEVATTFMVASNARDLNAATSVLDEAVFFDWGPNDGRDGLRAAWDWEDAFTLTHTLDVCRAQREGDVPVARCWLRVDSQVAEAAGNESGVVCVDVTVSERLITQVAALEPMEGCSYDYWPAMFAPFDEWLETAHPDTTARIMYLDRVSEEGLELWRSYTAEYLAAHGS